MKKAILSLLLCGLMGCESGDENSGNNSFTPDATIHKLPVSKAGFSCDLPPLEISGGDLMASADRIVVGTVTSVEAVQEFLPNSQNCADESVNWTVRVRLDVDENLKGSGTEVEFTLGTELQLEFWDSAPLYKRGDTWTPTYAGEPELQIGSNFGWSKDTGIQPGQELLAFLWESNGGLSPQSVPLAQRDASGFFQFQSDKIICVDLPTGFQGTTLEDLRGSLAEPAKSAEAQDQFGEMPGEPNSTCSVITPG